MRRRARAIDLLALAAMTSDLGAPSSWLAARPGLPVLSGEGDDVGEVLHILGDPGEDIFDGLVIESKVGDGGARFVDAEDVDEFFETGVRLRLTTGACGKLLRPSANPGAIEAHGDTPPPGHVQRHLRRAWDLLSGRG